MEDESDADLAAIQERILEITNDARSFGRLDDVVPIWHAMRLLLADIAEVIDVMQPSRDRDILEEAIAFAVRQINDAMCEEPKWVLSQSGGTGTGRYDNLDTRFSMAIAIANYVLGEVNPG